ncbi:hypothetical protein [Dendrosporobacter quercicolus]|uniref:hypothetical protein n=1 Tax=Dendrosporobacter quercicolus TaxID=146817 RepID=UPI001FDFD766|nr:hypothetical protein [Dendrosporobacter quercicolus]
MQNRAIFTIGDLAKREPDCLQLLLGAWGETLWHFANGSDITAVKRLGEESIAQSIGNSTTTPRDLQNLEEVDHLCTGRECCGPASLSRA